MKSTDHTHAGQVFPYQREYLVQAALHLFIKRNAGAHNPKDYHRQQRNCNRKDKSRLHVYGKCHDHGPEYNKRRAQKQAQKQVNPGLHLINITGHAGNERRCPNLVNFGKRQALYMGKYRMAQLGCHADSCFCRKKLCRNRTGQPDNAKSNHHHAHADNIAFIPLCNTHINYCRHDKRNNQLKHRFQHLKQRCKNAFFFIIF